MADTPIGRLKALLLMDDRQFRKQFGSIDHLLTKQARQFRRHGRKLSRNLTLPIAAIGVAISKFGVDFEAEMIKIETLVGVNRRTVEAWRKSILDLAPAVGRGPGELAKAMFAVSSAGARGQLALDILTGSAKAAAVGLGETREVALAVTAATTAYSRQNLSAGKALDTLVAIVREGNLEASELAGTLGHVIAVAAPAGVSLGDLGAAIALITRLGTPVSEAVTQVAAAIKQLNAPTVRTIPLMKEAFGSLEAAREQLQRGLLPVFRELVERFGDSPEKLRKLLGSSEALNAVLAITSQNADEVDRVFASLTDTAGVLEKAFNRTRDTAKQAFAEALAQAQALGIELAEGGLIDGIKNASRWIAKLAEKFREMDDGTRRGVLALGLLAAAVGPVLFVLGALGAALVPIIAAFTALVPLIGAGGALIVGLALLKVGVSGAALVWNKLKGALEETAGAAEKVGRRFEELEPVAKKIDRAMAIRARILEIDAKFQLAFEAHEPKEAIDALMHERELLEAELQSLSDEQGPISIGVKVQVGPGAAAGHPSKPTTEQKELAKRVKETIKALEIENDSLRRLYQAYKLGEDAVRAVTNQLEIEAAVRELGAGATDAQVAAITEEIKKRQALTTLIEEQQEILEKRAREEQRAAEEAANALQQPFLNAAENIQREFGNIFTDIFRNGVDSFKDLGDRVRDIMTRLAGEIAALLVFRPQVLQGGLGSVFGGTAGGVGTGGAYGVISQYGGVLSGLALGIGAGLAFNFGTGGRNVGEKVWGYVGSLIGSIIGARFGAKFGSSIFSAIGNYVVGGFGGGFYNLSRYGSIYAPGMSSSERARYAYAAPWAAYADLDMPLFGKMNMTQLNFAMGGLPALIGGFLGLFDPKKRKVQLQTTASRAAAGWEWGIAQPGPFGYVGLSEWTKRWPQDATQQLVDYFVEIDRAISLMLDPEDVARVAQALQTTAARREKFEKFDDELTYILGDRLRTIIDTLAGRPGFAIGMDIFKDIPFKKGHEGELVERAAQWLTERQGILDLIDELRGVGEPAVQAKQAVAEIEDLFAQIQLAAPAYGIGLSDIEDIRARAIQQLTIGFEEGIRAQITAILNPYQAALDALVEAQEQRLREAKYLGAELVEVERLNLLERERLLQEYAKSAKDLLLSLTAGPGSPLAPTEVLKAAEARFAELRGAVLGGDLGQLDALVDAAENLLTVSRDVFASSEQFFQRFRFVVATLENVTNSGLQGFQAGGSFVVPGSGIDNVVPLFRASGGETVSVSSRSETNRREQLLEVLTEETVGGNQDRRESEREIVKELRAMREMIGRQQAAIERLARRKAS